MSPSVTTLPDGKICDFIDGRIRSDTPEEYVRQNIERRLVLELGYSPDQVEVEFPISLGSGRRRMDIAIFPKNAAHSQENVWIIVECKSDLVQHTGKDGVGQLQSYLTTCLNAEWGMWTNGRFKAVFRKVVSQEGKITFEEPNDIPADGSNADEVDRPRREQLNNASDDNLLFSFKTCHDHIYVTDGLQKQPAFFEFLKVIFCKIHDERSFPNALEFYATAKEKASRDGQLTVANRIGKIFDKVKDRYPAVFDPSDEIKLEPRSLAYVVGELQRYSFLDTSIDVKGKAYEELVGSNLRGDRGEFFTPRNVQRMMIRMLSLKPDERFLDPACGTGGFLIIAMNEVVRRLNLIFETCGTMSPGQQKALQDRIQEIASQSFFGIDINPDLVKATKMNMVMNNDGSGNIFRQDSLRHPHDWTSEFRDEFAAAIGADLRRLRNPQDLALFDVVATNPPFGSRLPIRDRDVLVQYDLGHVWEKGSQGWVPTDKLQGSVPPEILFIERCWQFLKPGGRMAIVLPDAILGAPGLVHVRQWILQRCRLIASIDLHPDTFQPKNGTQTSVLLLQRKPDSDVFRELRQGHLSDYEIFMAELRAIGHDKRGNPVFKRNDDGEIVLVPDEGCRPLLLERQSGGGATVRPIRQARVIDDDTAWLADEFVLWKKEAALGW